MPFSLVMAALLAAGPTSRAAMCDQPWFRMLRTVGESNLVIRALGETVSASDALPPFVYADWQPPGSRPTISGQVVVVERVLGADSADVRRRLGSARKAVLVPWDHDTGCEPIPWTSRPRWIAPSTEGFVAARLRPREKWAGGMPTFDVRDAWREPYTPARVRLALGALGQGRSVMSPEEYGTFYQALPSVHEWTQDRLPSYEALLAWERANPALAAKAPAAMELARARRWLNQR
jgi:hypothetical protein